jgi:sodium/hydrogen antiporter
MAEAVLHANEQLERIAELTLVLFCGAVLTAVSFTWPAIGLAMVLFFVLRPIAVFPVAIACGMSGLQAVLASWFGVRGVGSLYYLFFALHRGVDDRTGHVLLTVCLVTVTLSVCLHGVSVTPLMTFYARRSPAALKK